MSYKNRANFKPLSNFIKRVNVKNKDGAVANLKGINIDKFFIFINRIRKNSIVC